MKIFYNHAVQFDIENIDNSNIHDLSNIVGTYLYNNQ